MAKHKGGFHVKGTSAHAGKKGRKKGGHKRRGRKK